MGGDEQETELKTTQLKEGKCYRGVRGYPHECGLIIKVLATGGLHTPQGDADSDCFMEIEILSGTLKNKTVWYVVAWDRWVEVSDEEVIAHRLAYTAYEEES